MVDLLTDRETAQADETAIHEEPTSLTASDGYTLSALWIRPSAPTHAVLIQAGTGLPMGFFKRFARFGARRGAACLLYDYRGIASSAPDNLATLQMDYPDWGRLDLPAAIEALVGRYPELPTAHIGHSVGGHFLGFAPNQDRLHRHAFVCVGSGFWGDHPVPTSLFGLLFWWAYGPLFLALKGYIPGGGLWGGAALPRGVFTTWRRWCNSRAYYLNELAERLKPHEFDNVTSPIRSFIYTDDPIANVKTAPVMLKAYPNAPSEIITRKPSDFGLKAIGHSGVFREKNAAAWPEIWDWALAV